MIGAALPAGELLCIGWKVSKPYAHYFRLDKDGRLQADVPIDLPEPVFMHDMAITKAGVTAGPSCLNFLLPLSILVVQVKKAWEEDSELCAHWLVQDYAVVLDLPLVFRPKVGGAPTCICLLLARGAV